MQIWPDRQHLRNQLSKKLTFKRFEESPVLWIRMDPELLAGSGSGILVPDPAKNERTYK